MRTLLSYTQVQCSLPKLHMFVILLCSLTNQVISSTYSKPVKNLNAVYYSEHSQYVNTNIVSQKTNVQFFMKF